MLRHDTDANNRMKELMASLQNLTLGVRAVVSQAAAGPSRSLPMPMASTHANSPSTFAIPAQQPVYKTSRDRAKSAPYPRLKNSKRTSKCQYTVLENRENKIVDRVALKGGNF